MSEQKSPDKSPYKPLGTHLKYLREQSRESIMEAAGSVEIEPAELTRIEDGLARPSEDILELLIQHYNPQEQEAMQLWELAGYEGEQDPRQRVEDIMSHMGNNKQLVMLMAMDVRTMYSDGLDVDITQAGLTMNFTQATSHNRRTTVGRIGMSYDQAAEVMKTLQTALLRANYLKHPRALPEPKDDSSTSQ